MATTSLQYISNLPKATDIDEITSSELLLSVKSGSSYTSKRVDYSTIMENIANDARAQLDVAVVAGINSRIETARTTAQDNAKTYTDNQISKTVTLEGDQTVKGVKTFESVPKLPEFALPTDSASTAMDLYAVNFKVLKNYVTGLIEADYTNYTKPVYLGPNTTGKLRKDIYRYYTLASGTVQNVNESYTMTDVISPTGEFSGIRVANIGRKFHHAICHTVVKDGATVVFQVCTGRLQLFQINGHCGLTTSNSIDNHVESIKNAVTSYATAPVNDANNWHVWDFTYLGPVIGGTGGQTITITNAAKGTRIYAFDGMKRNSNYGVMLPWVATGNLGEKFVVTEFYHED